MIADNLTFARRLLSESKPAGTPMDPQTRVEVVRPDLLPTEIIERIENLLTEDLRNHPRNYDIPGTRRIQP